MKKIVKYLVAFLLLVVAVPLFFLIKNNVGGGERSAQTYLDARSKAISWLNANKSKIYEDNNPMLWWMLDEANRTQPNQDLDVLVKEFKARYRSFYSDSEWTSLLYDEPVLYPMRSYDISPYRFYVHLFLFGLTCDAEMYATDAIRDQLDAQFCWNEHPLSPTCLTHQLMGVNFIQEHQCDVEENIPELENEIIRSIKSLLRVDFRVVDVYVQRLLMLSIENELGSGFNSQINHFLNAQNRDGGWDDFYPVIPLFGGSALGTGARSIKISDEASSFHATAQAVLLLSNLAQNN